MNLWIEIVTICRHVLAEQRHFAISGSSQFTYLLNNRGWRTAFFSAADVWHDAIGAVVVASVDDRDPGANIALSYHRNFRQIFGQFLKGLNYRCIGPLRLQNQIRQAVQIVRTKYYVDVRSALYHRLAGVLRNAAANCNERAWVIVFQLFPKP